MKTRTTKSAKLFVTALMVMLCFSMLNIKTLAAEKEKRDLYKVLTGTATKLGTDEKVKINDTYIELWEINEEKIEALSDETKSRFLNATNKEELPLEIGEVTAEVLTNLAKQLTPKAEKVYQGYAPLGIKEEIEGYTYSITIEGNIIRGYYVSLDGKTIYELELWCEISRWQDVRGTQQAYTSDNTGSGNGQSHRNTYEETKQEDFNQDTSGGSNSGTIQPPQIPGNPSNPGSGTPGGGSGTGSTPTTPGNPSNPGSGIPGGGSGTGSTPTIPSNPSNSGTGTPGGGSGTEI